MKFAGIVWFISGVAAIVFGLVAIWPWPWGSAWSSWVVVGEGGIFIVIGIVNLIADKRIK